MIETENYFETYKIHDHMQEIRPISQKFELLHLIKLPSVKNIHPWKGSSRC